MTELLKKLPNKAKQRKKKKQERECNNMKKENKRE